jgi:hypothetical protein
MEYVVGLQGQAWCFMIHRIGNDILGTRTKASVYLAGAGGSDDLIQATNT